MPNQAPIAQKDNPYCGPLGYLALTIGAEGSNIINLGIVAKDARLNLPGQRLALPFYLTDAAAAHGLIGTGVTSLAAGTRGKLHPKTASTKEGKLITDANGEADLAIEYTGGAKTLQVVFEMPDGTLQVSGDIVFA